MLISLAEDLVTSLQLGLGPATLWRILQQSHLTLSNLQNFHQYLESSQLEHCMLKMEVVWAEFFVLKYQKLSVTQVCLARFWASGGEHTKLSSTEQ